MKIYKSETIFIEVIENDNSYLFTELMGDDYVSVSFIAEKPLKIPLGSFINIDFYGSWLRYYLFAEPEIKKVAENEYEYNCFFGNANDVLKRIKFADLRDNGADFNVFEWQPSFYMFCNPTEFLTLLVYNLEKRNQTQFKFFAHKNNLDTTAKTLYFNNFSCFDALRYACEEFKTEWKMYYSENSVYIRIGFTEENKDTPLVLKYGYECGAKEGVKALVDDKDSFNLLWVLGDSRNINFAEYKNKNLLLPKAQMVKYDGKNYVTDPTGNFIVQPQNLTYDTITSYSSKITDVIQHLYTNDVHPGIKIECKSADIIESNGTTRANYIKFNNQVLKYFILKDSSLDFKIEIDLYLDSDFFLSDKDYLLAYIIEGDTEPNALNNVAGALYNVVKKGDDEFEITEIPKVFLERLTKKYFLNNFGATTGTFKLIISRKINFKLNTKYHIYIDKIVSKGNLNSTSMIFYFDFQNQKNLIVETSTISQKNKTEFFDESIPDNYDFENNKIGYSLDIEFLSGFHQQQVFRCNYDINKKSFIARENNGKALYLSGLQVSDSYSLTGFKLQTPNLVFPKLIKEADLDLTHIYPSRESMITDVIKMPDGWDFYDLTIPDSLNFKDYMIDGQPIKVIFQNGLLAGKEFEVDYYHKDASNNALRKFRIFFANHDGIDYPNDKFYPRRYDKYIVININMPSEYICDYANKSGASFVMLEEAIRYFHENHTEKINVNFEIDSVYFRRMYDDLKHKIVTGGYINIKDSFIPAVMPIRIKSIRYNLTDKYSPTIECFTNSKKISKYSQIAIETAVSQKKALVTKKETAGIINTHQKETRRGIEELRNTKQDKLSPLQIGNIDKIEQILQNIEDIYEVIV